MQRAVELEIAGRILRGMYHRPELGERFPTVIFFHGFTGTKLEPHRIFWKLSRILESRGIASVRFDFGGSGESDGDFEEMTLSSEVSEAGAILDYTLGLPATDQRRVGIVGLSLGGAVASILAGLRFSHIKALVLWAATTTPSMKSRLPLRLAKAYQDARNCYDLEGLWLNPGFAEDLENWDTYHQIEKFQGSALILHGAEDPSVPVEIALKYHQILKGRSRLELIPEADHTFNRYDWEGAVLTKTADFLEEVM